MVYSSIFAISLLATVAHAQSNNAPFIAKNDWSKPCFNGECTWDHPVQSTGPNAGSSGGMKIWGSSDGLSDITEAAGWMILDCDKNKMDQDIRLVCKSDNTADAGCDHLSQNASPEGKIIRLPDSCGKMPFARVAKFWVPQDQSIPQDAMKKIARRANAAPQVKAMTIDTKFGSGNATTSNTMNIAIQGANFPGNPAGNVTAPVKPNRRSRLADRGFFDFVGDAINAISSAATTVVNTVSNTVNDGINAIEGANNVNVGKNDTLPAIDIKQDFPIFSGTINCPAAPPSQGFSATLNADLDTQAHAVITIGIAAVGTIVPPKLDDFSVFAGLDANINAALHVTAQASGQLDSGVKQLFEKGIPGLDFPGIFTLGPSLQINGRLDSQLEADFDMTVNLAYTADNVQLVFPPGSNKKSSGNFKPADSDLKLSANPSITAQGTVEGHIIPTINVGLNFLDGVAQASVFLDLDASATLDLTLQAQANLSTEVKVTAPPNSSKNVDKKTQVSVSKEVDNKAPASVLKDVGNKAQASVSKAVGNKAARDASASINGCVDVKGGLSVNAGAQGSFFSFFNDQTQVSLFSKNFDIFQKCFGAQTPNAPGNATQAAQAAQAAIAVAAGANSPAAAIAGAVESAEAAAQSAAPADKSATNAEKSATTAEKSATTAEKSAAPANKAVTATKGSSKKTSRRRLTRRGALGCGTQSVTTSLASIVEQAIGAAGITAI